MEVWVHLKKKVSVEIFRRILDRIPESKESNWRKNISTNKFQEEFQRKLNVLEESFGIFLEELVAKSLNKISVCISGDIQNVFLPRCLLEEHSGGICEKLHGRKTLHEFQKE